MPTFNHFRISPGKLVLMGLFLLAVAPAMAQEPQTDPTPVQADPKAQERIKNLRIAYISDKLGLTPEQAEKFWPVYREFVEERKKLRNEFKVSQLNINPDRTDPKKQQELIDMGLRIKQKELDLEKTYSNRLLQVINPQQMLNLHKAEKEFRSLIINQLQQKRLVQQRKENFRDKNQLLKQRDK